jgi:hypothetical protein
MCARAARLLPPTLTDRVDRRNATQRQTQDVKQRCSGHYRAETTRACEKTANLSLALRCTKPELASSSPASSFSSVDLPAVRDCDDRTYFEYANRKRCYRNGEIQTTTTTTTNHGVPPLGPTSATRESMSMFRLTFFNIGLLAPTHDRSMFY